MDQQVRLMQERGIWKPPANGDDQAGTSAHNRTDVQKKEDDSKRITMSKV
jgi:hypothetical protein